MKNKQPLPIKFYLCGPRRDARVAEWGGLENRCAGNRTEGSNPSLSANTLFLNHFPQFLYLSFQFFYNFLLFLNGFYQWHHKTFIAETVVLLR